MAQLALTGLLDRFPSGTTVGAYPQSNWATYQLPPSGSPVGSATTTANVSAAGAVTLTGLADDTDYFITDSSGTKYVRSSTRISHAFIKGGDTAGGDLSGTLPSPSVKSIDAQLAPAPTGTDRAALQSLIDNSPYAVGVVDIALRPGTYVLDATGPLSLPKSAVGLRIRGAGVGSTTIQLSTAAKRAFDLNRTADYDVFQNIEISDLTVDANNVASAQNQHVVLGNLIDGGWSQRINAQNIAVRRVRTANVPTASTDGSSTGSRQNVSIVSRHLGSSEGTQTSVKDILVEDCDFQGGGVGVAAGGSEPGNTANVFVDNIRVHRLKHDTLVTPTATAVHANVQIGLSGFGGRCEVIDCDFANSADVGIEIDGMTESIVERTRVTDSWNSNFFVRNFNTPRYQNAQRALFRACEARVVNLNPVSGGATSSGYVLSNANAPSPTVTSIALIDCKFNSRATNFSISNGQAIEGLDTPYARLLVRNFEAILDNLADASAGALNPRVIRVRSSASNSVVFDDVRLKVAGTTTNASLAPQYVYVATGTSLTSTLDLSGLSYDVSLSGMSAGNSRLLLLGSGATSGTLRGAVRRMVIEAASGDANMKSICITSSASGNAISPLLLIENCDLSKNPGGFDVTDWDATNRAKVKLVGNRFKLSTGYDVASAATIAAWSGQPVNVTGTTGITAVTVVPKSEIVTLGFAGALTVTDNGTTLNLAGNFTSTAGSTLTLRSDGTNMLEVARAVV